MIAAALNLNSAVDAKRARRAFLKAAVADGGRSRTSTALLMLDTVAAIGFAAGLSQAVVAVPRGTASVFPWAMLMLAAGVARGTSARLAAHTGANGARQAKLRLRHNLVESAFGRRPIRNSSTRSSSTGALITAVVDEVDAIDGYVARFLPGRQAAALAPLLIFAVVAVASPVASAILLATLVPFITGMILAGGAAADESRRQFAALSRLSGQFADRVRALPVILAFRAEAHETAALGTAADEVARRTMQVLRVAFLSSGALEFFAALSVALVAVYCGFNLLGILPFPVPEKLDLSRAFFVLALAPEFYAPLRRLAAAYHDRQAADTAAERLQLLVRSTSLRPVRPALPLQAAALIFDDVSIAYAGNTEPAVRGFSLVVPAGQVVALVGPSGSGKTSLLNLLLGLVSLDRGHVSLGGIDLAEAGDFAAVTAWVGQSPLILPGSIRDNITLADPAATARDVERVIAATGLYPILAARPDGLDTKLDARGSGLSGGERCRIALARALLKPAPLLLLDEPTAHLDAVSEAAMIATIRRVCAGRTVLIATHSEQLAAIASRIVQLAG